MSSKKKLKNDIKRLKIKLQLLRSDVLVATSAAQYQAHFELQRADRLADENVKLREQLAAVPTKDLFESMKTVDATPVHPDVEVEITASTI